MYRIQQFADLFGVSSKTLRLYDNVGLFCPAEKISNNRRYYTMAQVSKFANILELKEIGFSLEEIKAIISGETSDEENRAAYELKAEVVKKLLCRLDVKENKAAPFYIREFPATTVVKKVIKGAKQEDVGRLFYDFINTIISKGLVITSAYNAFAEFDKMQFEGGVIDCDFYISVKPVEGVTELFPKKTCLVSYYKGNYANKADTYKKMYDYVQRAGLTLSGKPIERYLETNGYPERFDALITEVRLPIIRNRK